MIPQWKFQTTHMLYCCHMTSLNMSEIAFVHCTLQTAHYILQMQRVIQVFQAHRKLKSYAQYAYCRNGSMSSYGTHRGQCKILHSRDSMHVCVRVSHAVVENAAGRGPLGLTEGRGGMMETVGLEWVFPSTGEPGMAGTFFSALSEKPERLSWRLTDHLLSS